MIYKGRGVLDFVKVFQEKTIAIIHPLAGNPSLNNKYEHRLQYALNPQTHQCIPFANIIDGIDSNIKVFHQAEGLNPIWQFCCEEVVNCLVNSPNITAVARNLQQVSCPELTSISQSIPNVCLPASRKIFNFSKGNKVIQPTNVPLQPLLH